jgi:hypothetical protein
MTHRRSTGLALLAAIMLSTAGCQERLPQNGSRAIVPADHLEQQRLKMEQMTASIKVPSRSEARKLPVKAYYGQRTATNGQNN